MKVVKFGGTSIADAERINKVIEIIKFLREEGNLAVVVSALAGVTETLIQLTRLAAAGKRDYLKRLDELHLMHLTTSQLLIPSDSVEREILSRFESLKDTLQGIFLVRECSPRLLDFTMSFGERLSASLLSSALNDRGVPAEYLNASRVVKTDNQFGNATVDINVAGFILFLFTVGSKDTDFRHAVFAT